VTGHRVFSRAGTGLMREHLRGLHPSHKEMMQMFRKFFAAVVAVMLVVGGLFAEDITGVFKKYDDGKVTVEVDGKEKTYKVDKDAKIKNKKTGDETLLTEALSKRKADSKITLVVEGDVVKGMKGGGGKGK